MCSCQAAILTTFAFYIPSFIRVSLAFVYFYAISKYYTTSTNYLLLSGNTTRLLVGQDKLFKTWRSAYLKSEDKD